MTVRRRKHRPRRSTATELLHQDIARANNPGDGALGWVLEILEADPAYVHRRMFGCDAAYLGGLLCLVTATNGEPWNGLLVCTSRDRQAALRADWPQLAPHDVLGKWLYLSQDHADFESVAKALTMQALARDPRIGVEPKLRKRRQKSQRPRKKAPVKKRARR